MSGLLKQLVSLILLIGLLVGVVGLRPDAAELLKSCVAALQRQPSQPKDEFDSAQALKNYGFYLTEVSKESGIDFKHEPPVLDAKLDHIMPIVASMGASVSVVDFDRDGLPDLYVINSAIGSKNRLYRNLGNGKFEDVAEKMGLADLNKDGTGVCMGAVWGDFDNDGYEDLLIYKWGGPELFHNDAGKGFTRVTDMAGLPKWLNANSAVWFDYDRDGQLDLFIAGYWPDDLDLFHLKTTEVMPESFEYAKNGGRKYLLRNRGKDKDGKWLGFEDVTKKMGISSTRWTLAVAAGNLCGSGYPDLFLANDYGVSELYANRKGERFEEIGERAGVAEHPKSGMNVSFGDIYNKGRFAVYVSNITEPKLLTQGNNLWVPKEAAAGQDPRYANLANGLGVEQGGWSWGAQFGDLNNDGRLDLFLTNGYISGERNKESYWFDYSRIAGAHNLIISDAKNWPAMKGRSLSGYQQKCVWINKGGKFVDISQAIGASDLNDGRSVVLVDLWNRGVLDVVVANQNGPLLVYKNTVAPENQWIQFELEGTKSNRSAIGARVRLSWTDDRDQAQEQVQEVSGGNGYAAQNQRALHFGLGKNPKVEKVTIEWPSGQTQTLSDLKTGLRRTVKEPQ